MFYFLFLTVFACAGLNAASGIECDFLNPHEFLRNNIMKGNFLGVQQHIATVPGLFFHRQNAIDACKVSTKGPVKEKNDLIDVLKKQAPVALHAKEKTQGSSKVPPLKKRLFEFKKLQQFFKKKQDSVKKAFGSIFKKSKRSSFNVDEFLNELAQNDTPIIFRDEDGNLNLR